MKLLLITCVSEYEKEVKNILKHTGVKSFSYQSVKGYKNRAEKDPGTWFVAGDMPIDSLVFFVFIDDGCMADIFLRAEKFNQTVSSLSRLHITCLNIEKYI